MTKKITNEMQLFCKAVLTLETEEEVYKFFDDICTAQELRSISQRIEVAKLLLAGKPYLEIAKETGSSTATISRVKRALDDGGEGYLKAFEKMKK